MPDATKAGTKSGQPEGPETPTGRAQLSPAASAFAAEAQDLNALRDAVVEAAGVGAGLWLSYLFVLFYLLIAVGGVTHRNLFFENPVKLPFLNVDLPLTGFFVLGPGLFLIVHAYVLLHFVLLAGKVGVFHTELQAQISDENARAQLRRQLPSNIFVQFLAGPVEVRTGIVGMMLRLIAWISLVAGPLALLVFFQLQFLPYHDEAVTWWQRAAVVIDLILLWMLWPSVTRGEAIADAWRNVRRRSVAAAVAASAVPDLLVFTIATFPGEKLNDNLPSAQFPWPRLNGALLWFSLHEILVNGDVDLVTGKLTSLWSNRLVLPGVEVPPGTFSLRGRRLEAAVLLSARLTKVDLTAARLQGAELDGANLEGASFECEKRKRHDEDTRECAQLQGAKLVNARLQGASFNGALLQGAQLDKAQLQGASFVDAQLQGASLWHAQLQGASLEKAQLQGASLDEAQLQGASLVRAGLQGAVLNGAHLQGASLHDAKLQGASLNRSNLQGTLLVDTELQGASLDEAELHGALLSYVFAWRTDARYTKGKGVRVVGPETKPQYSTRDCSPPCDWSATMFAALKRTFEEQIPEGNRRVEALQRVAILDPVADLKEQKEMADAWAGLERSSPFPDVYEKSLAALWHETGCKPVGAPYVIRGLLRNLRNGLGSDSIGGRLASPASQTIEFLKPGGPQRAMLAGKFLDEANCAGAIGLLEENKIELRAMIPDRHAPALPK